MYGTVATFTVKEGQGAAMVKMMQEWEETRRRDIEGAIAGYLYKLDSDPDRFVLAVVFKDRETYHRNADDPAQDEWYRKFREFLVDDPQWSDGEIVHTSG